MNHLMFMGICLLMGCAQGPNDIIEESPMFTEVDSKLQPYFDEFQTLSGGVSVKGITAGFASLDKGIAGLCVWGGVYNEIRIGDDWDEFSENQKQQLISHELGHCALFLQHINDCTDGSTAPDGTQTTCNKGFNMPRSIMNWQMFTDPQADTLTNSPGTYYEYLKLNEAIP